MNKKTNNKKSLRLKLIGFWSIMGVATVAFIIVVVLMFIELRPIETYEDIERAKLTLIGDQMFTRTEDSYYVYIYTTNESNTKIDTLKAEELKPIIFNYFNFVQQYSRRDSIKKIYGLDVNYIMNRTCVSTVNSPSSVTSFANFTVNEAQLPMLLYMEAGAIYTQKITVNDIQNELQNAMETIRPLHIEAYIPNKETLF